MLSNIVKKSSYYDSVTLMLVTKELKGLADIGDVSVMMGSDHNKELMRRSGLLDAGGGEAGPEDLIIAVEGKTDKAIRNSLNRLEEMLSQRSGSPERTGAAEACEAGIVKEECNLALISVPGQYAALEAKLALDEGLNVFLFSDNVSVEEEVFLKNYASERNLLVMGPDCGTSILNGVGLGFANAVKRGNAGIVSASGTGLQEVACLLDARGIGISHAIGTGGRDLSGKVMGSSMLKGLRLLEEDADTEVIVAISKPPHPEAAGKIYAASEQFRKPVVFCFFDRGSRWDKDKLRYASSDLEEAADIAAGILEAKGHKIRRNAHEGDLKKLASEEAEKMSGRQKYIHALYTGGTLCYEAVLIGLEHIPEIRSNIHLQDAALLEYAEDGVGNVYIDLGDDAFTRGRPHPMIDPEDRVARFARAAGRPDTAVVLLDFVLGRGGHGDPAGIIAEAIVKARQAAAEEGRHLTVIASVCGTESDSPGRSGQVEKLLASGAVVMPSNAKAALLAAWIGEYRQEGDKSHGKKFAQ